MADAVAHAQALRSSAQYRIGDAEMSEGCEAQDHLGRIAERTRLLLVHEQDWVCRVGRSLVRDIVPGRVERRLPVRQVDLRVREVRWLQRVDERSDVLLVSSATSIVPNVVDERALRPIQAREQCHERCFDHRKLLRGEAG